MSKKKYRCPKCGQTVELFVHPSETPHCENERAHRSRKIVIMEESK